MAPAESRIYMPLARATFSLPLLLLLLLLLPLQAHIEPVPRSPFAVPRA
jgi:hypothetical protein